MAHHTQAECEALGKTWFPGPPAYCEGYPPPTTPPTTPPTQPPACPVGQEMKYGRCVPKKSPFPKPGGGYGGSPRYPKRPHPPRGGFRECNRRPWRFRNCHDEAKYHYLRYRRWPAWWFWGDVWPIPFGWPGGRGRGICNAIFGGKCNMECGPGGSPGECLDCSFACGPSWRGYGQRYGHKMGGGYGGGGGYDEGDINVYNINNEFSNPEYGGEREGGGEEEMAPPPPPAPAGFDMSSLTSSPIILIGGALMLMMFMMKK